MQTAPGKCTAAAAAISLALALALALAVAVAVCVVVAWVLADVEVVEAGAVEVEGVRAGEVAVDDGGCGDPGLPWQGQAPRRATVRADTPRSRVPRVRGADRTTGVAGIVLEPIPPPLHRAKP